MNRKFFFRLVLPFTIIVFFCVTKKWHTIPIDAPDTEFLGFPFPYVCNGWHTSMSLQIFILEMFADFIIYLLFFLALFSLVLRFFRFKICKVITIFFWSFVLILIVFNSWSASFKENLFHTKRNFNIQVIKTEWTINPLW